MDVMTNVLARSLTTWKAWYAALGLVALLLASTIMVLAGPGEGSSGSVLGAALVPVQFLAMAFVSLGLIALVSRRWPTTEDLALRQRLTRRELGLLAGVFVVTHIAFYLLAGGESSGPEARKLFAETGFDGPLLPAVLGVVATVILAPVCEEILYRGAVLRPIHDHIARRGSSTVAAVVAIAVSTVAFVMPHVTGEEGAGVVAAYVLTGAVFGLVYVVTGSMTAAMVSHSLQSCFATVQILAFGKGDHEVSPVLWVLVLACPLLVYLCARGLHAVLPKREGSVAASRG